jgi:hypothetical protein
MAWPGFVQNLIKVGNIQNLDKSDVFKTG